MKVVKGAVWGSALALALGCGALAWAEEEPVDTTLVAEEPAGEETTDPAVEETTDPADEGTTDPDAEETPPKEEEEVVEDPNLEDFPTVVDDTTETPAEEEPVKEDPPAEEPTGETPDGEQPEIVILPVDDPTTWVPPPGMTPEEELIWMTMMEASGGQIDNAAEAPEPATIMLVGLGGASLLGWGAWRRRKQKV